MIHTNNPYIITTQQLNDIASYPFQLHLSFSHPIIVTHLLSRTAFYTHHHSQLLPYSIILIIIITISFKQSID